MDLYIFIIIIFSTTSIILTEFYLRVIEFANNKKNEYEQDKIKLIIYPSFLILILMMSIGPDYILKSRFDIGALTFLPFFNMGAYVVANWKRSVSILHKKQN
jgi:hypothetical protein